MPPTSLFSPSRSSQRKQAPIKHKPLPPQEFQSFVTSAAAKHPNQLEICILAGGLSSRMGRDKSTLRLGGRTLLSRIRAVSRAAGWRTRVIRRDLIPGHGPLGGIVTALKTTKAKAVLFLACDMPLIRGEILTRTIREFNRNPFRDLFTKSGQIGFPLVITRASLGKIEKQLRSGRLSLHGLARSLRARTLRAPRGWTLALMNANSPEEWEAMRRVWRRSQLVKAASIK